MNGELLTFLISAAIAMTRVGVIFGSVAAFAQLNKSIRLSRAYRTITLSPDVKGNNWKRVIMGACVGVSAYALATIGIPNFRPSSLHILYINFTWTGFLWAFSFALQADNRKVRDEVNNISGVVRRKSTA